MSTKELRDLLARAAAGPWVPAPGTEPRPCIQVGPIHIRREVYDARRRKCLSQPLSEMRDDELELVCAAVNALPGMLDLIDAITKDLGLPEGTDFAVVRVRGMAQRAALQEWVDYFDSLDRDAEPGDPLVAIRLRVHGPRMARSRAALAKTDALGGPGGKEQPKAEAQEGAKGHDYGCNRPVRPVSADDLQEGFGPE